MTMSEAEKKCEKECKEPKGIRRLGTFVTASALLAAVLLVWAQLWIHPSIDLFGRFYCPTHTPEIGRWFNNFSTNVSYGLLFTYLAVFLALLAIVLAVWYSLKDRTDEVPVYAVSLFGSAITMAIIDVLQSFISVFKKLTMRDVTIWIPFRIDAFDAWFKWLVGVFVILLVVGVAVFICRAHKFKESKCERKAWYICGGVFLVWGALLLIKFWFAF